MSVVHDFDECLKFSEEAADEPFWEQVYRKAFPTLASIAKNTAKGEAQSRGIDRLLLLQNGKTLYVDEKKRSVDYGDILLEYVSNDVKGTPGWIEKDLQIDFLAYAFIPSARCYLFPWLHLQRAWSHMGDDWKQRHRKITAKNEKYQTLSVAVPTDELLKSVSRASIIDLSKPKPCPPVANGTSKQMTLTALR